MEHVVTICLESYSLREIVIWTLDTMSHLPDSCPTHRLQYLRLLLICSCLHTALVRHGSQRQQYVPVINVSMDGLSQWIRNSVTVFCQDIKANLHLHRCYDVDYI